MDSYGQFRDGYVGTIGSVIYAPPQVVPSKLSDLIDFVNATLSGLDKRSNDHRTYAICLAGYFLSEFLLIHPFCDGNGRTARLLISHLVRAYTVVPLSLFTQHSPRSAYLKALEAEGRVDIPWAVIDFVMECAKTTMCKIAVWQKS
jgi:Fic family protein